MVAGNLIALDVRERSQLRTLPASLVLYRIGDDGRLEFAGKYDVETAGATQFWTGMVTLP